MKPKEKLETQPLKEKPIKLIMRVITLLLLLSFIGLFLFQFIKTNNIVGPEDLKKYSYISMALISISVITLLSFISKINSLKAILSVILLFVLVLSTPFLVYSYKHDISLKDLEVRLEEMKNIQSIEKPEEEKSIKNSLKVGMKSVEELDLRNLSDEELKELYLKLDKELSNRLKKDLNNLSEKELDALKREIEAQLQEKEYGLH